MRSATLLSLLSLLTPTQCIKLRKTEFNVLISSRQSLVLFTADGCKECDRVQKVLDQVSPVLTQTAIASVNCNEEPAVCDEAKVFAVPTVKYTTGNNELVTYKEVLDASSVVKYIERQSGPPVTDLTDKSHLDFARSSRVAIVAFLGPSGNEEERKTFNTVAEQWRAHYSFGYINSPTEHNTGPSIVVYTQEEDDPIYYNGDFNLPDIETFLRKVTEPLIWEFDPDSHDQAIAIFFSRHDERIELVKSMVPLAKKYKDQFRFMTVLAPDYPKRCEVMHLNKDIKRGFAIADPQGRAYPMSTTAFNVNRVTKHISAFLAGSLTPAIKSEPVPEASTSQPFMTALVGSTFDAFVYNKSRDVLVEFHVPWCQYCTDLHNVMNDLGSKYAKLGVSDKVALATINVDANDVPINIDSYPSIRLYRAGNKDIIPFQGNFTQMLTVEELEAFVLSHGSHGVGSVNQGSGIGHDEL
ncbi:putative disulfide-isomerase precursor [Fusarium heterosporum]|uniref:Protein disulfide-isomerase n=1 Tax=Fusarium heterosporum TaxID=42747 RepID=A0A8H5WDR4_FUSHE|nr:putative disulfide-isomerase precursor [Fusarium heterosporum]